VAKHKKNRRRGPKKKQQASSGRGASQGRPGEGDRQGQGPRKSGGGPGASSGQRANGFRRRSEKAGRKHGGGGRTFQGKVDKNASGFAFLVPVEEGFEDVYVNRREAAPLMDGDIVEFSVDSDGRRSQAHIVRVVKRAQSKLIGRLEQHGRRWTVSTQDGEQLNVEPSAGGRSGDWVIADIQEYPTQKRPGFVQVTKQLGQNLGPEHDLEIAITRYGLFDKFGANTLNEANALHAVAEKELQTAVPLNKAGGATFISKRLDLTPLPLVTIDGEDAKDFDDAILVQPSEGGYTLFVAIADVSFFVTKGSLLDKEAILRGTSVYFPSTCLPMLPEVLSNDLCSLRPQVPRLALTAEIQFSKSGEAIRSRFYPSVIKTAERLTYTQVQAYFDGKRDAVSERVHEPLQHARELYRVLDTQRQQRGVLDFDLPECKVLLDERGFPVRVFQAERLAAHKLIEEFMIAANREVAKALREAEVPALYRVHDAPSPESIDELNTLLITLGIKKKVDKVTSKAFAHVLEGTAELKIAGTLHHSILRLQKQARYMPEPRGHFGLALADYTHFTSPIRRYPDLVVHRALKGLCTHSQSSDKPYGAGTPEEMVTVGERTSNSERRAMEAERWVLRRKQCWYMEQKLGEEFEGVIAGFSSAGIFVNIPWMALDGFVPLEMMLTHYEIDEEHMCARQRPGNTVIHLGDPMRIQVLKVSLDEGKITFGQSKTQSKTPNKSEPNAQNKKTTTKGSSSN
jgi:ribonuclease R